LIPANKFCNHTFSFWKLSSDIDFEASTITNKSMLSVIQGIPVKESSGNIRTVGAGVGRLGVGG
jgi:hypothetical protein